MAVEIVPSAEKHIGGFHRCLDGVAREKKFLVFTEAPPLEAIRAFVLGLAGKAGLQFVAVDDGTVVGWCDITRKSREALGHTGVLGMGIGKTHRHQGIGRRLIEAAIDQAKAIGIERVELAVYSDNLNAIRLYESAGFSREGMQVRFAKIDGAYKDSIFMARFP